LTEVKKSDLGWTSGKVGGLIEPLANVVAGNDHQNKCEKPGAFFEAKIRPV
jgi:hypothetical protein